MARDNVVASAILLLVLALWSSIYLSDIAVLFENSQIPAIAMMVIVIGGIIYVAYAGTMS